MSRIYNEITELIGNTPLLRLCGFEKHYSLNARIIAKLEYLNPAGSVKDRIAKSMIDDAERGGLLKKGGLVIEPTSGNTGIGLAMICAARGYRVIFTMPETMSAERRILLKAYGAELILTKAEDGMKGAIDKAHELAAANPGSFMPSQFSNPANPAAHKAATGPEIWADTGGDIDIFVCGIGTGGTISGTGGFLKAKNPGIKIIGIEPAASPILTGGKAGTHKLQGIGAGFVPDNLDASIYDEIITVSDEDAFVESRTVAGTDGILVGISSGAALFAASQAARRMENTKKSVVVILPDSGERYLSTQLFE